MSLTNMFNEATSQEMLLTSWQKHRSKCSLIINDDVINLLYYETSSSTGFENETEFFGTKMVAFLKEKAKISKFQVTTVPLDYLM